MLYLFWADKSLNLFSSILPWKGRNRPSGSCACRGTCETRAPSKGRSGQSCSRGTWKPVCPVLLREERSPDEKVWSRPDHSENRQSDF